MSEQSSFRDLIRRVRARDKQAEAELVGRYEPAVRVAVRVRLSNPALRSLLDSTDICQSVLFNFFRRLSLGQFDLDTPEQLMNLLITMARNRLANHVRQQRAARRDSRRLQKGGAHESELIAPGPSASEVVAHRELLEKLRERLSADERRLADQRAAGLSWVEIAAQTGENADALRMRLARAIDRVFKELRLDE